ncbi:lamin tail domain-containing protein [Aeromicrobium sp. Leaf350]|uniref:metallophosphoesterase n=1 Tax=Aeromicrobium sp. Leaf350 TaxID=2876565 RepID=UPI001E62C772|nr:lamin tail domain-containing protein [Aeromicrobium sp. Leaf350]
MTLAASPLPTSTRPARALLHVLLGTAMLAATLVAGLAAPAAAATPPPLFVSEILANPTGVDEFEYVEVTNPGTAPVALDGFTFAYTYVDSTDTTRDVRLTVDGTATVAPKGSVVLWLSYTATGLDSFARTVDQFRAATGTPASTQVLRLTGQPGMANGGDRGIRISDATGIVTWSHYPSGSQAIDLGTDFSVPSARGQAAPVLATLSPMTPGTVRPEALVPVVPVDPEPEVPDDIGTLDPDPALVAAPLQITEMVPDTANVGASDGYEFIEVFNATDRDVDFADYALTYLYPQDTTTNTNEAAWPAVPSDVVIGSGEALTFWIKNGANDDLTDADFNAHHGSDLTLGEDLVEISSAGLANGSPRGIAIRTNTGFPVNRAYYNMAGADDVDADVAIAYGRTDDIGLQTIVARRDASPGRVQVDQVAAGLVVVPDDTSAPVVADRTADTIDPTAGFLLDLQVSDDVQVRTVTVEVSNDVDTDPRTVNLVRSTADPLAYGTVVNAADVVGKQWFEYTVTASDGSNVTRTETRRVAVDGASSDPVRLNVKDGDFVGGTTTISAAGESYPPSLELSIDGSPVETRASLESTPYFVFETSQTDFYFRNGVRIGEDVLHIFDEGTYERTETIAVPVPLSYVTQGEPLSVDVWAGTKAGPWIDEAENNDDFVISGMRLILPDGRTLRPAGYDDPTRLVQMGDSAGKNDFYASVFDLGDDAFTAAAHDWDTTVVADGPHQVLATEGADSASAEVLVDNTAPTVTPSVEDGRVYQGEILLDAVIEDGSGSGVTDTVATLDGEPVVLPFATSSVVLAAGDHVLAITATDAVGNTTESSVTFTVPEEQPGADGVAPAEGAEVEAGDVILQALVQDPTDDPLDVSFRRGERFVLGDEEVAASSGTTHDARSLEREGTPAAPESPSPARQLAAQQLVTQAGLAPVTATDALPYYTFDVAVPADSGADATARLTWDGTADRDSQVILYALAADGSRWIELARHRTTADGEAFTLQGSAVVGDTVRDGSITVLVQHSEGFAGADLSSRDSAVTPAHPLDTPRSEYDFTIAWESDTQYYNEEFLQHQTAIHDYVLGQRENQNIQYLIHTGDIIDDWDQPYQWANADGEYARLDAAGLPYGVLAGNHDVGSQLSNYSEFWKFFGEARYADNPWYGGSYQDNRGHYDLISAGGIDFVMLYMGWDPQVDSIAWMNEVLAQYPERVAVINLHEFMLTTGGLGPVPQQILDEVVATNPNVRMVLSGHYHDAFTRIDQFDDDGDGAVDRDVYSMLFDYQGLPEGGQGFLRLLQFDNEGQSMRVRTYSPSLATYNSDDPSLLEPGPDPYRYQDFEIGYDALLITPSDKTLTTSGFTAEILTTDEVGALQDVPSGTVAAITWPLTALGAHGWYVHTADPFGATHATPVYTFTLVAAAPGPGGGGTNPGTGTDPGGSGGAGGTGTDATGTTRPAGVDRDLPGTGLPVDPLLLLLAAGLVGLGGWLLRHRRAVS